MSKKRQYRTLLGLASLILVGTSAAGNTPGVWRGPHTLRVDDRVVIDRLNSDNNASHEDHSFLNAVGVVLSADLQMKAAAYSAATGFLISSCHVLTNMHVAYTDDVVVDPPLGIPIAFAVGQTEGAADRGALQGLRYLLHGKVVAHGNTIILDRHVHNPESDWALIRLSTRVDESIEPMAIAAVDGALLTKDIRLSVAGFPSDHRTRRANGLNFKDLWGSAGRVVGVISSEAAGAVIETTIQASRGNSGSPVFADIDGRRHIVVGMVQGVRGNGIDVSEAAPNVEVLFTAPVLSQIATAQASTPCP